VCTRTIRKRKRKKPGSTTSALREMRGGRGSPSGLTEGGGGHFPSFKLKKGGEKRGRGVNTFERRGKGEKTTDSKFANNHGYKEKGRERKKGAARSGRGKSVPPSTTTGDKEEKKGRRALPYIP